MDFRLAVNRKCPLPKTMVRWGAPCGSCGLGVQKCRRTPTSHIMTFQPSDQRNMLAILVHFGPRGQLGDFATWGSFLGQFQEFRLSHLASTKHRCFLANIQDNQSQFYSIPGSAIISRYEDVALVVLDNASGCII